MVREKREKFEKFSLALDKKPVILLVVNVAFEPLFLFLFFFFRE